MKERGGCLARLLTALRYLSTNEFGNAEILRGEDQRDVKADPLTSAFRRAGARCEIDIRGVGYDD
ncbi:MAG TPA: hypothetical protein DEB40_06600 [Elusimicrobia bacterium]|nr:hypothetical protein [Elusimicrobiota bacterium]HBT61397.1 hypothetical protein [Elusimicrobiota bacterium]